MSSEQDPELQDLLAKHGREPVSWAMLDGTISALQEGLRTAFQKHRNARLALEQRVAALEGKPHVKFCGVWKAGTYQPGDAATHAGGLWICKVATTGEPTKDFVGWVLAVKRGSVR